MPRKGHTQKREVLADPIYGSKVQRVCPKCGKGVRVGYQIKDGKKVRVCKKCGAEI